jgi:hypothetical protein
MAHTQIPPPPPTLLKMSESEDGLRYLTRIDNDTILFRLFLLIETICDFNRARILYNPTTTTP